MQSPRLAAAAVLVFSLLPFRAAVAAVAADDDQADAPIVAPLVTPADLSPDSPLAPMPDLEVPWPDLEERAPSPDEEKAQRSITADRHYSVQIEGLGDVRVHELTGEFDGLSALKREAAHDAAANAAQIDRRAREDADLLAELLRAHGYYDGRVERLITAAPQDQNRLLVTLTADPGPLFTYSSVEVRGVDAAHAGEIRALLPLKAGDAVDAQQTQAAELQLKTQLPRHGYVFATVGTADILVDHDNNQASYAIPVDIGPAARFGDIHVTGDRVFGPRHISHIARFSQGQAYDSADVDDLRRAIIATGLVSEVEIKPVRGNTLDDGSVLADLDVKMAAAPMRTIAGTAGYDTGQGARVELSWQHRNLLPPEGAVTFRGVAGTKEQLLGAELRRSNFRKRDQVLAGQFSLQRQRLDAYDAETASLGLGIERQTNIIWQKKWIWSFGGELLATRETDNHRTGSSNGTRTYFIAATPVRLAYDSSDDLLDPHRGFRLSGRVSPEVSLQSGQSGYVRMQLDGSGYLPLGSDRYVLAGRVRLGSIQGASTFSIAPSRRFYAGGGGSVRGFSYQGIGPKDANGDPVGGSSLTEFAVEARIRFGNIGIVPFLDAGQLYTSAQPKFSGFRYGTGLGVRYHSSFGPIRVDVGTPLHRRSGESRLAIYVSLGQAF